MKKSISDQDHPFDKVMGDADALREAAIDAGDPKFRPAAEDLLQTILQQAKSRPVIALLIAAALGFVVASLTSR